MHTSNLHGEVAGMKAQLQQCAEAWQGIRGEIAKIQSWQGQGRSRSQPYQDKLHRHKRRCGKPGTNLLNCGKIAPDIPGIVFV